MRSLVRLSLAGSISGLCPRYPAALFLIHTNTNRKATAMKYRVEYNQGEDGQWYTSIRHVNGERLYTSEGYTRRESAVETLENFIEGMIEDFLTGQLEKLYAKSKRDAGQ